MTVPAILEEKPLPSTRLPIVRPHLPGFDDMSKEVEQIISSGALTKGRYLEQFEQAAAASLQVEHAIGVSSCTVGLMLTYIALGLKGEVITPSFTFMATVSSVVLCGLQPVFVDVKRSNTNLDPEAVEAAITPRTSAIVAVHNFGNPADIEALEQIAQKYNLALIFDAAHGMGSLYRGRSVGAQGAAQAFSLSPTKLVVAGEGGLVATNDAHLAEKIRMGREYGISQNYDSAFAGLNGRLAEFNAILGRRSLAMLQQAVIRRNQVAALYRRELRQLRGIGFQQVHPQDRCSYKDFAITVQPEQFGINRDELALALQHENIDTRAYYHPPAHRQTAYRRFADKIDLPHTSWLSKNILCLPIWSHMTDDTATTICRAIASVHAYAQQVKKACRP